MNATLETTEREATERSFNRHPKYVRDLMEQLAHETERKQRLAFDIVELKRYITSDKFSKENWVNVRDVLDRLPSIFQSDLA